MSAVRKFTRRRFGLFSAILGLAALAAFLGADALRAQSSGSDVFRVEEDWQLIVGTPTTADNAPQVTCTISPLDMGTAYCAFDLNYRTQPDYLAGGMQVHTWDPTDPIEYSNSVHTQIMATTGETVTWTQTMTWQNNAITFQVVNGQSQTWGTFGGNGVGQGRLILSLNTSLANLDGYSPDVSLNNSGVSYASNQVVSLTLMAVRYYDVNGKLINQITTPQVVHPQN